MEERARDRERDRDVHEAVVEAGEAKLQASEARVVALQAQLTNLLENHRGRGGGTESGRQRYRVDDGGAVAFRKSPSSDDRSTKAAEAGLLIEEIGRVVKKDGAVWVQHRNELWLPLAFLEPYEPENAATDRQRAADTDRAATDTERDSETERETTEPEPEPDREAAKIQTGTEKETQRGSVSAMVAKLNTPKERQAARQAERQTETDREAWGDAGGAAMARVAVRASAAESEAQRARADASAKEVERLVATVAELKAALRTSARDREEAQRAQKETERARAKLEGESAVNSEKAISTRRSLEEEKNRGATLAKQAERAEERIAEMAQELTDLRMQLSAQQTRAVTVAAELLAAEEAASAAKKASDQRVQDLQRRCDDAIKVRYARRSLSLFRSLALTVCVCVCVCVCSGATSCSHCRRWQRRPTTRSPRLPAPHT